MAKSRLVSAVAAVLFSTFFVSSPTLAAPIIIEPDNYAFGTDLSNISPYVSLRTTGGSAVYASTIDQGTTLAAGGYDTGPFGDAVFSSNPSSNSEWDYWPDFDPTNPNGLTITFNQPVLSFSLLFGELFPDAVCCYTDPITVDIFAPGGAFIERVYGDASPLGGILGTTGNPDDEWRYWQFEYSANTVGKVVVGGTSEPTSIDRLTFTVVPVPAAVWLFISGLMGLVGMARRNKAF